MLVTGDMIKDEFVRSCHLSNIQLFRTIVENESSDSYQSRHLTVSVSEDGMERIINRISHLRSEILSIAHKDEKKPNGSVRSLFIHFLNRGRIRYESAFISFTYRYTVELLNLG